MVKARTLTVHIRRHIADVYEFLVNPRNLSQWTLAGDPRHEPAAGLLVWSYDTPEGRVVMHFTRPNPFFVLDYKISLNGEFTHEGYARLIQAGDETVVTHTAVQKASVTDARFASEAEWIMADLLVLKTLLESA